MKSQTRRKIGITCSICNVINEGNYHTFISQGITICIREKLQTRFGGLQK